MTYKLGGDGDSERERGRYIIGQLESVCPGGD